MKNPIKLQPHGRQLVSRRFSKEPKSYDVAVRTLTMVSVLARNEAEAIRLACESYLDEDPFEITGDII